MSKFYKSDMDKQNCKFELNIVLSMKANYCCRCAVNDNICELCVILYYVMFYCFEILLIYDIVSVMLV